MPAQIVVSKWHYDRLVAFLRQNTALVADTRDSNAPWLLRAAIDKYEEKRKR